MTIVLSAFLTVFGILSLTVLLILRRVVIHFLDADASRSEELHNSRAFQPSKQSADCSKHR